MKTRVRLPAQQAPGRQFAIRKRILLRDYISTPFQSQGTRVKHSGSGSTLNTQHLSFLASEHLVDTPEGRQYTHHDMANQANAAVEPSVQNLGRLIAGAFVFLGETAELAGGAFRFISRGRISARETLSQMNAIGVGSLPIVLIINFSTGAVFAYYTSQVFVQFGATQFVGGTLTYAFLNELGPLLAGIAVAARSGAAIAAELGSMVVTEQIDALRAMAVPPIRFLVVPRLVAALLMMPVLGVLGDVAGVSGSMIMSAAGGVPPQAFLESVRSFVGSGDFVNGLIKTVWFGLTIALTACHQGLKTSGGAVGVGRATTNSVVICVVLIFVSDFFLAQMLTGGRIGVQ